MFGPKSPADRSAYLNSVISWTHYAILGGGCQYISFGQNTPQTQPLGLSPGGVASPRRSALGRQGVAGVNASS